MLKAGAAKASRRRTVSLSILIAFGGQDAKDSIILGKDVCVTAGHTQVKLTHACVETWRTKSEKERRFVVEGNCSKEIKIIITNYICSELFY